MAVVTDQLNAALADRYVIERELGQGGMATVYLARDLRHDRKVALKVLRSELAAVIGADRFLAEIKTTANLQHPHILPLHDSGEAGGLVFYVMPYVEGESLRDRLSRETQLPVDEAVRLTCEVASALDYAHRKGVVHRDIKPENLLLHDGRAVVADFGIALAVSRSDGGTRMTETGMSLGTPHYMSPEQAMGEREITAKSDVYALGCVLYETLTGEPPFTGPTAQAIVARVMTEEPRSLTLQRRTIPPHVEAAVHKALAKLPADRFAGAAQFADALTNPTLAPAAVAAAPGTRSAVPAFRRSAAVIAAVAAFTLAGGFIAGRTLAPAPARTLVQFPIQAPDSVGGFARCCGNPLALSPDGETLVFVGVKGSGGPLYRRTLGGLEAEPIPGTEGASVPFFSPDGRWLGFFADGRLLKVSMAGGPPIPIATTERVGEASWGDGDVIIFGGRLDGKSLLFTVPASGGEPRALTSPDSLTGHYAPSFLPGGRAALLTMRERGSGIESARIGVVDLESGTVDTLGLGTRAAYANGYLVYAGGDNTLLAQPFDPKRRAATGQAVAILDRIALHGNTTHPFALSATGGLAYQPGGGGPASSGEALRLAGPAGRSTITLPGRSADNLEDPAISPDGRRIALRLSGGGTGTLSQDIWVLDRQQGTLERLTVGGGSVPSWSRDGRRIAYSRNDGIYVGPADGTSDPDLVLRGLSLFPGSWLPDGRSLVFQANGRPTTLADIGLVTLGDTAPRWLVATEFRERHPQVSPDGRWLAYASDRTGQFEVYVQPLAGEGPRVQVSTEGGDSPRWSPDGRTLYYVVGAAIVAAARAPGTGFEIASRKTAAETSVMDINFSNVNWDIHPNGREFVYIDQGGAEGARLVWILDWPEMVRAMNTGT
jgi:serine/threonine-protein kinase